MNLAFFIFKYFPYGGLERDMLKIALACIAQGHEVVVYTTQWEGEIPQRLKINLVKKRGVTNHGRMQNFSNEINQIKEQYDLKVGFNKLSGLDLCFVGDICFQYRYQKNWLIKQFSARYKAYLRLEKAVFSPENKTQIILLSKRQKQDYQYCYKTPDKRLHLVSPGIQKNGYSSEKRQQIRQAIRENLQIKNEEVVLLFVASSFYTKGLDRVLKALAQLPDLKITLWVIGGDKLAPYQKLILSLKLQDKVRFLGSQPNVSSFMLGADVFVNPARAESAGKAMLEALTIGLPVIATKNCGYSDYVIDAKGGVIIAEEFSLHEFVHALREVVDINKRRFFTHHAQQYFDAIKFDRFEEEVTSCIASIGRANKY